jgi:hypothetical protein
MVPFPRWTQLFGEYRFQGISPDLVPLDGRMELVASVDHAVNQLAVPICQAGIHVEIPNLFPVGKFGQIIIDPIYGRHDSRIAVAWENARHDDRRVRSLRLHDVDDCSDAIGDVRHFDVIAAMEHRISDVIRASEQHNNLRIHSVELPVSEPPEDVLNCIGAPPQIGRIPPEEVLIPIGQQVRIIGGPQRRVIESPSK